MTTCMHSRLSSVSILCGDYVPLLSSTLISYAIFFFFFLVSDAALCKFLFYFLASLVLGGEVTFLDSTVAVWHVSGRKL